MARFGVVEQPLPTLEVPDEFFALREIASRLQGQIRDTTRATNRLHNVLARVFPELATLVNNLAVGWLITLLKKYPTSQRIAAARLAGEDSLPESGACQKVAGCGAEHDRFLEWWRGRGTRQRVCGTTGALPKKR